VHREKLCADASQAWSPRNPSKGPAKKPTMSTISEAPPFKGSISYASEEGVSCAIFSFYIIHMPPIKVKHLSSSDTPHGLCMWSGQVVMHLANIKRLLSKFKHYFPMAHLKNCMHSHKNTHNGLITISELTSINKMLCSYKLLLFCLYYYLVFPNLKIRDPSGALNNLLLP
jgi:hypothetical protein